MDTTPPVEWDRQRTLEIIRKQTDTVFLSFSRGKDALACWCTLLDAGFRVVPFHCEGPPGMEFIEDSLRYYEKFFQTKIYRVIHPHFYNYLHKQHFQLPWTAPTIYAMQLPAYDWEDVREAVARTVKYKGTVWGAQGARAADSITRRNAINRKGPINWEKKYFLPVFDMKKEELIRLLKQHNVKLPIDYTIWGRTWDGLDYRFLKPLKEHFPRDYQLIKKWFPLVDLELARAEIARRHGQAA